MTSVLNHAAEVDPAASTNDQDTTKNTWYVGQEVDVEPRTWPGINRPGGHGRIVQINYFEDDIDGEIESVDVKYTLSGGFDNNLLLHLIKPHEELNRGRRSRSKREFFADKFQSDKNAVESIRPKSKDKENKDVPKKSSSTKKANKKQRTALTTIPTKTTINDNENTKTNKSGKENGKKKQSLNSSKQKQEQPHNEAKKQKTLLNFYTNSTTAKNTTNMEDDNKCVATKNPKIQQDKKNTESKKKRKKPSTTTTTAAADGCNDSNNKKQKIAYPKNGLTSKTEKKQKKHPNKNNKDDEEEKEKSKDKKTKQLKRSSSIPKLLILSTNKKNVTTMNDVDHTHNASATATPSSLRHHSNGTNDEHHDDQISPLSLPPCFKNSNSKKKKLNDNSSLKRKLQEEESKENMKKSVKNTSSSDISGPSASKKDKQIDICDIDKKKSKEQKHESGIATSNKGNTTIMSNGSKPKNGVEQQPQQLGLHKENACIDQTKFFSMNSNKNAGKKILQKNQSLQQTKTGKKSSVITQIASTISTKISNVSGTNLLAEKQNNNTNKKKKSNSKDAKNSKLQMVYQLQYDNAVDYVKDLIGTNNNSENDDSSQKHNTVTAPTSLTAISTHGNSGLPGNNNCNRDDANINSNNDNNVGHELQEEEIQKAKAKEQTFYKHFFELLQKNDSQIDESILTNELVTDKTVGKVDTNFTKQEVELFLLKLTEQNKIMRSDGVIYSI